MWVVLNQQWDKREDDNYLDRQTRAVCTFINPDAMKHIEDSKVTKEVVLSGKMPLEPRELSSKIVNAIRNAHREEEGVVPGGMEDVV